MDTLYEPPGRAPGSGARRVLLQAALCLLLAPAAAALAAETAPPKALKPPPEATAMPAFRLPTTGGATLDSASLKGKVVVVRFWASW